MARNKKAPRYGLKACFQRRNRNVEMCNPTRAIDAIVFGEHLLADGIPVPAARSPVTWTLRPDYPALSKRSDVSLSA